ncbi:MAG TPA: hypothetical protein VF143_09510 [Candidatus Nanopelagicales bacterium]
MGGQPGTPETNEPYEPVTQDPIPGAGAGDEVPNPDTGVGIGMGEESSFEPEEDPEAASAD